MAKQQFTTHRELGDALLRQFPNEYEGQNPYRLGKKYAERNPETVEVTGDVEFESDFLQTAGESIEGMYDLASGAVSDVIDAPRKVITDTVSDVYETGSDAASMVKDAFTGTPSGDSDRETQAVREGRRIAFTGDAEQAFPFLRSLAGLGKGTLESGVTQLARAAGLPEATISGIEYSSSPSELRAGEDFISTYQEQLEPYNIKQRPFRALANIAPFLPGKSVSSMATKLGVSAPRVTQGQKILSALNPDNILSTGVDAAKLTGQGIQKAAKVADKVVEPVREFGKRAATEGKSFVKEVATNIAGFTTSRSPEAIEALTQLLDDAGAVEHFRKYRSMPKQKLYDTITEKFSSAVGKLRDNASKAYVASEKKLAPILSRPMNAEMPNAVESLQDEIIKMVEDKGGKIKYISSEKIPEKMAMDFDAPDRGRRAPKVASMSLGQAIRELGGISVEAADYDVGSLFKTDSGRIRKYLTRIENKSKRENRPSPRGMDQIAEELAQRYPQFNIRSTDDLIDAMMDPDEFFELKPIDVADTVEDIAQREMADVLEAEGLADDAMDFGEDYAADSQIRVSFSDAPIIPTTTDLKRPIAKLIQNYLNLDPAKVTGTQLHNMRKDLDKFIENLPGDGSPGDVYGGSYRMLTEMRKSISEALENTYKEPYINAMKDYKNIIDLRNELFESYGVRGNVLDKKTIERLSGEISLTFGDNARQSQRSKRLKELTDQVNMPELYTAIIGAQFQPLISKGLAQRSVQSALVAGLAGGTGAAALGAEALGTAIAGLGTVAIQQIMYSPRMFYEAMATLGGVNIPTAKAKQVIDRVKSSGAGARILRDNPSFPVAVERLKNEAGIDVESILASDRDEENRDPKLLRNLSTIGETQPVR